MKQIYTPRQTTTGTDQMRVFVFFSGGASSLAAMLDDPNHGKLYRVAGAYTDNEGAKGRTLCNKKGVRHFFLDRKKLYRDMGFDKSPESRREFYSILARQIAPFEPDLICLSGYMHLVADTFIERYEDRILNVHPADLSVLNGSDAQRLDVSLLCSADVMRLARHNGIKRKLTGQNAVRDAVESGERETRSTVHIVDAGTDTGPIVTQSRPFKIHRQIIERDGLDTYAKRLQDMMKTEGDGPAYLKALELISQGRVSAEDEQLFLDGKPLPYCGVRLG